MIAPATEIEIRRLLQQGKLSQRKIALAVGVSRGTVHAIARGKRPDHTQRGTGAEHAPLEPARPMQRCPTCGGLVQMPCLLCRIRRLQQLGLLRRACWDD